MKSELCEKAYKLAIVSQSCAIKLIIIRAYKHKGL